MICRMASPRVTLISGIGQFHLNPVNYLRPAEDSISRILLTCRNFRYRLPAPDIFLNKFAIRNSVCYNEVL